MMDLQNNQKIVNNDNCKFLPITTLKINGLNLSVKRYRMADGLKKKKDKKRLNHMLPTRDSLGH